MFLSLLSSLSFSIFIPPTSSKGQFKPLPLNQIDEILNSSRLLIGLAAKPRDSRLIFRFFDAQPLFPTARFELFAPIDFRKTIPKVPRSPYLVIFENGKLVSMIGQINSDLTLAFLLDLHITKSRPVLDSLDGALFGAPVTIIARPQQFEEAYNLSLLSVPANVILVSEKVASSLNFNTSELSLFRQTDLAFATFPATSAAYKAAASPLFSYYNEEKLMRSHDLVFAFHSKEPEENITEFLCELGSQYRDFRFVYAPRGETFAITDFIRIVFHHPYTHIAVINYSARFYYDISSLVTREQFDEEPFNATIWRQRIHQIITAVRDDRLPKVYKSEYETEREAGNLQYVVGTNYWKYALNETADTFVFFHKPNCPNCPFVFNEVLRKFAREVEQLKNLSYEFIHIDTSTNRIQEGFPVRAAGGIALYPANSTSAVVLPFESYDLLLWFANKYAAAKHPFGFELPDEETWGKIRERVEELELDMNETNRERLRAVVRELRAEIDGAVGKSDIEGKPHDYGWKREFIEKLEL